MDSLDHHDGIIDHDGNRQEQGRERQQVDGEAEYPEEEECTDQGHRHGNHRNQSRTEVLQKDIYDKEHQYQRDYQRTYHLFDGSEEELGYVLLYRHLHARRHLLLCISQSSLHIVGDIRSIGPCNLIDHTDDSRTVVVLYRNRILQTAHFNLCHITQVKGLAIRVARDDDIAILFRGLQTALVAHGVLVLQVALLAERTWCSLDVLLCQSPRNVRRHQSVLLHLLRLQPDAHGISLHTRCLHITDSADTLQHRHDVDVVIVRQELVVISTVVRRQRVHDHIGGLSFRYRHTHSRHLCRQQCLCLRHTVLHIDGSHVRVRPLFEVDRNHSRTVVCGGRLHIGHVLHTVDTLLQRRDDRVQYRLGISTLIRGHDGNRRRGDIRIPLDGQRHQSNRTQKYEEDGYNRREYRSFDKIRKCHNTGC